MSLASLRRGCALAGYAVHLDTCIAVTGHLVYPADVLRCAAVINEIARIAVLVPHDVRVISGKPGSGLPHQHHRVHLDDMFGPFALGFGASFDAFYIACPCVFEEGGHPIDAVLNSARVIGGCGAALWARGHQHVRKSMHENSEIRLNTSTVPFFLKLLAVGTADVDMVESACDRIEPGRIDNKVEFVFPFRGLDPCFCNALDRRFRDVDQLDVLAVISLVVIGLEGYPLYAAQFARR